MSCFEVPDVTWVLGWGALALDAWKSLHYTTHMKLYYIFITITSVKIYKQAVLDPKPDIIVQKVLSTESEASTNLYTLLNIIG